MQSLNIIGAGLAGVSAAFVASKMDIKVNLFEQKPKYKSEAHKEDTFAELVCSNSLKSKLLSSASGLLKEEMRILGSDLLEIADICSTKAGQALAVDRHLFTKLITEKINSDKNITVINEKITEVPTKGINIIATGPLTDKKLADNIKNMLGEHLHFYDAAAPIVTKESLDGNFYEYATRYNKGDPDYINCYMNKDEYTLFYDELVNAKSAPLHDFDKEIKVYEGCMPVEVLAKRGFDCLRFGPLKPVGFIDKRTGFRPFAVVQLRAEDKECSLYNLVGFQTNLTFSEQKRVFSLIPGLKEANFMRYGVMHKNLFINSPKVLDFDLSLKKNHNLFFAGQITGVEGYMESAMCGMIAGINAARRIKEKKPVILPKTTMSFNLINHVTNSVSKNFQPLGANFGILPKLDEIIKDKKLRYETLSQKSLADLNEFAKTL